VITPPDLRLPTRPLSPELVQTLNRLQPGQRIKLIQTVRVGARTWTATTVGTFRGVNYLATGLATDRVPEDDIVVPVVHFTKDNGELSSITLDEHSRVEVEPAV
jgi:hypothetical protein